MVRIGREECMHEEVRKISVADLARKEANRQHAGNKQKHLEEAEHKVIIYQNSCFFMLSSVHHIKLLHLPCYHLFFRNKCY